jgi:K+-dependent Na+/Ca+ exchanger-like protein
MLFFNLGVLLFSFYLLHFFSEHYFIPALDEIGEKLRMSSDIAGATLMAAGSSAPELAVVIVSVIKSGNHLGIGVGTIVGSALFNLFIIVGAVMVLKNNSRLIWQPLVRDLLFYAFSVVLLVWFFKDGTISTWEALLFVAGYVIYFIALYSWKKILPYEDIEQSVENDNTNDQPNRFELLLKRFIPRINNLYVAFFLSVVVISLLSWVLVESAIQISETLNIPEVIIALTVIALGTSVPDLVSSVIVAKQGRPGMAINNAIGSNIFDILIGLGVPLLLLHSITIGNINVLSKDLDLAFIFLMGSIVILSLTFILSKWHTKRGVGIAMIVIYILYLVYETMCSMGYFCISI